MLVVERGDLVFVFNFHPVNSFSDYRVGAYLPGPYKARAWHGLPGSACNETASNRAPLTTSGMTGDQPLLE